MAFDPHELRDTGGKWVRMGRGDLEAVMHAAAEPRARHIAMVNGKGGDAKHIALVQRDIRENALKKHGRVAPTVHVKVEDTGTRVIVKVHRPGSPRVEVHKIPKYKDAGNVEHKVMRAGIPNPEDIVNKENFDKKQHASRMAPAPGTSAIKRNLKHALPADVASNVPGLTGVAKEAARKARSARKPSLAPDTQLNDATDHKRQIEALRADKKITRAQADRVIAIFGRHKNMGGLENRDLGSQAAYYWERAGRFGLKKPDKDALEAVVKAHADKVAAGFRPGGAEAAARDAARIAADQGAVARRERERLERLRAGRGAPMKHLATIAPQSEMERKLSTGNIKNIKHHGGGINGEGTFRGELDDGTGVFIKTAEGAYDGGRVREEIPAGNDHGHERVGALIAQALGVEAPMVVVRHDVKGTGHDGIASVQNSIGTHAGHHLDERKMAEDVRHIALLDMVLGNLDRHQGNIRVDTHAGRVYPIDAGLSFPDQGGAGLGNHRFAEKYFGQDLRDDEVNALHRLLGDVTVWNEAQRYLTPSQVDLTRLRIQKMISRRAFLRATREMTGDIRR